MTRCDCLVVVLVLICDLLVFAHCSSNDGGGEAGSKDRFHRQFDAAMQMLKSGEIDEAEKLLLAARSEVVDVPIPVVHFNLALLRMTKNMYTEAIQHFMDSAVVRWQGQADAFLSAGVAMEKLGNAMEALRFHKTAIRLQPNNAIALNNAGHQLARLPRQHKKEAVLLFRKALAINPQLGHAYVGLGSVLHEIGFCRQASHMYDVALQLDPSLHEARFNRANTLREMGYTVQATQEYRLLIDHIAALVGTRPEISLLLAKTYNNLGNLVNAAGEYDEAIKNFEFGCKLDPSLAMGYVNLAETLRLVGNFDAAAETVEKALQIERDLPVAVSNYILYLMNLWEWDKVETEMKILRDIAFRNGKGLDKASTEEPAVSGYQAISFPFSAEETHQFLLHFGEHIAIRSRSMTLTTPPNWFSLFSTTAQSRLHLAYMSSDFKEHTTGRNIARIFALHERTKIKVTCFSLSPSDGSETYLYISSHAENFVDLSALSTVEAAEEINRAVVHILVDMNGYTYGARSDIIALKPAAITMFDQGFAGSSGGLIDYFNADKISVPPEYSWMLTEKLTIMPWFSNPLNNHMLKSQYVLTTNFTRQQVGISAADEHSFLYGGFVTPYKVDKMTFDLWKRIVQRTQSEERSKLWLLQWDGLNAAQERQLQKENMTDYVIKTMMLPKHEHIGMKGVADVFLDSPGFNAHGTAAEALWAALPVLTAPMVRIGQRIAASVCHAANASWGIARTIDDYEALGVAMYKQRHKVYRQLRQQLKSSRLTAPLFDIPGYVKDYERMLHMLWESHQQSHQQSRKHVVTALKNK